MNSSHSAFPFKQLLQEINEAEEDFKLRYPGDSALRQPVHTVYGGAQLFKAATVKKLGQMARQTRQIYMPDVNTVRQLLRPFGGAWESGDLAELVFERVKKKLESEPVEDFRIDFEDGFGNRSDEEEDATAIRTAEQLSEGIEQKMLSPFIGIRIKPFNHERGERALKTLQIFLTSLADQSHRPKKLIVTLPKVQYPRQVAICLEAIRAIEQQTALEEGYVDLEIMVETPQSIIGFGGATPLMNMVRAGGGRVRAAHFGTYDYTASSDITAAYQQMDHMVCDFAHLHMKAALAETGVFISDGATNVMPVAPHKMSGPDPLNDIQQKENKDAVMNAWSISIRHIRHSLYKGIYQGWDLHPGQLPVRYLAVYSFFVEQLPEMTKRLKHFLQQAARATLTDDVFDDAATGQGLLNFFIKAKNCGAIGNEEVMAAGLSLEELQSRSFYRILENRKLS